jgi:hypothetical protein
VLPPGTVSPLQGFGGMNGHLRSSSMLGVWPQGLVYFGQFLATLQG